MRGVIYSTGSGRVELNIVSSPSFSLCGSQTSLLLLAAPEAVVSRAGAAAGPQRAAWRAGVGWPELDSVHPECLGELAWGGQSWALPTVGVQGSCCGVVRPGLCTPCCCGFCSMANLGSNLESHLGRVAVRDSEWGVFVKGRVFAACGTCCWHSRALFGVKSNAGVSCRGLAGDFPAGTSITRWLLPAASLKDLRGLSPGSATRSGRMDRGCGLWGSSCGSQLPRSALIQCCPEDGEGDVEGMQLQPSGVASTQQRSCSLR